MPDATSVASFTSLLQAFVPCFTAPSFETFAVLMSGWVLNLRRHTVTGTVQAAQAVGYKHISSFHRFFSQARWSLDAVGLVLVELIVASLRDPHEPILVPVDDSLGRHNGKKIAAASLHRDPLLSTAARPQFHWGHVWVVLAINVHAFGKVWALPVLFRLYRSKKLCKAQRRPHRKSTELARELIELLARVLPNRKLIVVGDAAYTNRAVMRQRPSNVTVIGRCRLDAALYAPPPAPRRGQMGRRRVRGKRLPSPGELSKSKKARWQRVEVTVYGKTVVVRVLVIDALWYVATHSELVRLVLVRGFPGHERDDVFVCTDPTLDPQTIIERFSRRWPLEVTFHDSKGKLGFEEPQNRTERAVERTAPMALLAYSFVVLWYIRSGQHPRVARLVTMPWYASKTAPAFSDMLAALRRASWLERLSVPCANVATLRKLMRPIVAYAAAV
jgi:SRSO17 transposase